jgi:quercetin dioxygenase-like cupin family protein
MTTAATHEIHDPILGYWITCKREGENLIIDTRVRAGGGTRPHSHPNGEERFSIEEGEVEFTVGGRKVIAGPGDVLSVPRGTKHAFKNVGGAEALFRAELVPEPTGKGEQFFIEAAAAAERGMYTKRGVPTGPRAALHMLEILERYQDFAVVSSPPPAVQRLLFPLARRFAR